MAINANLHLGTPGWTGDNTGVPFAWSSATLAPDVLDHIQRAMASSLGDLIARPNSARVAGHRVAQGFYHSLFEPNSLGKIRAHQSQLAPPALRALLECVRRGFAPRLLRVLKNSDTKLSHELRSLIASGALFGDVNVQVHAGAPVTDPKEIYWHVDRPNSAIHMAVSIFGQRRLHSRCGAACNVSQTWQRAGSVYLSSPSAFVHGVEYPSHVGSNLADSVVAVQARILLANTSVVKQLDEGQRETNGALETFRLIAYAISAEPSPLLALPTLEELKQVERSLPRASPVLSVPRALPARSLPQASTAQLRAVPVHEPRHARRTQPPSPTVNHTAGNPINWGTTPAFHYPRARASASLGSWMDSVRRFFG